MAETVRKTDSDSKVLWGVGYRSTSRINIIHICGVLHVCVEVFLEFFHPRYGSRDEKINKIRGLGMIVLIDSVFGGQSYPTGRTQCVNIMLYLLYHTLHINMRNYTSELRKAPESLCPHRR